MAVRTDYELDIDEQVILEVHYQYDLALTESPERGAQAGCFLLMGNGLNTAITTIHLPLTIGKEKEFEFDIKHMNECVGLLSTTQENLRPCGILLLNKNVYNYDNVILKLLEEQPDAIKCVVCYNPNNQSKDLDISCFQIDAAGLPAWKLYESLYCIHKSEIDIPINTGRDTDQVKFTQSLVRSVDKIIRYLQFTDCNDPLILKKVAVLVATINKPGTLDIEQALLEQEIELKCIETLCQQWELVD